MDAILDALRALEAIALDAMEDPDEEIRSTAARALKEAAEARALLHCGDMRAVVAAMCAGVQVGILSRESDVRMAAALARSEVDLEMYPDASIGKRSRTANPDGRPAKGPPDDVLRAMVQAEFDAGARKKHVAVQRVRHKLYICALKEGRDPDTVPSEDRIDKRTRGVTKKKAYPPSG
jgi:hypothetical protein